jgi:hypothetical protein
MVLRRPQGYASRRTCGDQQDLAIATSSFSTILRVLPLLATGCCHRSVEQVRIPPTMTLIDPGSAGMSCGYPSGTALTASRSGDLLRARPELCRARFVVS